MILNLLFDYPKRYILKRIPMSYNTITHSSWKYYNTIIKRSYIYIYIYMTTVVKVHSTVVQVRTEQFNVYIYQDLI